MCAVDAVCIDWIGWSCWTHTNTTIPVRTTCLLVNHTAPNSAFSAQVRSSTTAASTLQRHSRPTVTEVYLYKKSTHLQYSDQRRYRRWRPGLGFCEGWPICVELKKQGIRKGVGFFARDNEPLSPARRYMEALSCLVRCRARPGLPEGFSSFQLVEMASPARIASICLLLSSFDYAPVLAAVRWLFTLDD